MVHLNEPGPARRYLMRLSTATLPGLPLTVARPQYDRAGCGIGIVHIGIGAFHQAYQAVYTDENWTASTTQTLLAMLENGTETACQHKF